MASARISPVHARLARLVCECSTVRRQRAHVLKFAHYRIQLGVLSDGTTDLHPVVVRRNRASILGTWPLLRMALSVRGAAGADEQRRQSHWCAADTSAVGPARAPLADQVHHLYILV